MSEIHIVGGGLAGLVAAISAAEAGAVPTLFESGQRLGGRARTRGQVHRTNLGPHALYFGGPMEAWLRKRDLLPETSPPRVTALRTLWKKRARRVPLMLLPMMRSLRHEAPVDLDYRSFARRHMRASAAEAAIGFASLPTFHPDPGALSAAFVHERIRRSMVRPAVGYIHGGWETLVSSLAARARQLGVSFRMGKKVAPLAGQPEVPTIVATDLPAARKLLDDPELDYPCVRHVFLDVSLERRRRDPLAVLDLDLRLYGSDYGAYDPSLAPAGHSLLQWVTGLRQGEGVREGLARIHDALDRTYRNWRDRVAFEQKGVIDGGTGAVDPPGRAWQDRPSIERGNGVWLAGDRVAAPGLLSEVSVVSAVRAASAATQTESEL